MIYKRGWGPNELYAEKVIIPTWTSSMQNMNQQFSILSFNLFEWKFTDNNRYGSKNMQSLKTRRNRENDNKMAVWHKGTNIRNLCDGFKSARGTITTTSHSEDSNKLQNARRKSKAGRYASFHTGKHLHALTQAHPDQLMRICKDANWATPEFENSFDTT